MAWEFAKSALRRFKKNTTNGILAHYHNGDVKKRKGFDFTVYDECSGVPKLDTDAKTFWGKEVVNCEVCKCILHKTDAYRTVTTENGSVYRVMDSIMAGIWGYPVFTSTPKEIDADRGDTGDYEVVEHFFCQRCKPVKKTVKKVKKTNKKK